MSRTAPSILLVPYRWGSDLLGGAETLHRRLAAELRDLGCHVAVWTTTAHQFRPFCHWGNDWQVFLPPGTSNEDGIPVTRFPAMRYPRPLLGLLAKSVQRDWEQNPPNTRAASLDSIERPMLGGGWHEPEPAGEGLVRRWCGARALLHLPAGLPMGNLRLEGIAPWPVTLRLMDEEGRLFVEERCHGGFVVECALAHPSRRLILECRGARRPLREFRTLGMQVTRLVASGREASLWEDWRALLSDDDWWAAAARRPRWADLFFDALRGPNSPALQRALALHGGRFDVVVSMNLPWRLFRPAPRPGGPVRVVLPLMHPSDGYYYWRHYAEAIRGADLVAAMSEGTANSILRPLNPSTAVIGAPVWPDSEPIERTRHGGGVNVLTVCRKVPEKGYRAVAESVLRLQAAGVAVRGTGVGQDHDGYSIPPGFEWAGAVSDARLRELYSQSDILVLMSESESFGMVVVEAWHAGLPVVVNSRCRALASLVRDGVDGLLAAPGSECDRAISRLASSPELRERLGAAGRARAAGEFVRGACATRLLEALRPLLDSRRTASNARSAT